MWNFLLGILPTILQIAGYLIDKSNLSKEQKQEFFNWVRQAGTDLGSVKLHKYGETQLQYLKNTPFTETK